VIERIITASFRKPLPVVVLSLAGAFLGLLAFRDLPRDVFPDLSAPVFNVIVQNPAMGAEELEMAIAVPMETALAGLPNVRRIRSNNQLGVSQITIEFEPDADYYRSRQFVAERVSQAASELPPGTDAPLVSSLTGRLNPRVSKTVAAKRIRTEYIGFGIVLPVVLAVSILAGSWLPVLCWLLPAVLVAEPAHFLIELPEHYGLNTQTDPNVLTNTRTVQAGWFGRWYTNGNDLHTAHHYHQGVPMAQVPRLHQLITDRIGTVDASFPRFYRKVLTGELRFQGDDETCMTR